MGRVRRPPAGAGRGARPRSSSGRPAPSLALSRGQLLDVLIRPSRRRRGRGRPAPLPNRVNWMRDEPVFRASTAPFMASPWTRPAVHGAGSGNRRRCRAPPAPRRCRAAAPGRSRAPICGGRAWRGADVDRHRIAGGETLPERFVQRVFVMLLGRGGGRRDGPVGGGAGGAVHKEVLWTVDEVRQGQANWKAVWVSPATTTSAAYCCALRRSPLPSRRV